MHAEDCTQRAVIIYWFPALLWAGMAFILGYCRHDCRDIISKPVSFLLICGVVASVLECIGVAMIAGYR